MPAQPLERSLRAVVGSLLSPPVQAGRGGTSRRPKRCLPEPRLAARLELFPPRPLQGDQRLPVLLLEGDQRLP